MGSAHNCLMFLPAIAPHTAENRGLIAKNNIKQTAIPALPANSTASQGQPIIKSIANIDQTINFLIQALSSTTSSSFNFLQIRIYLSINCITFFNTSILSYGFFAISKEWFASSTYKALILCSSQYSL